MKKNSPTDKGRKIEIMEYMRTHKIRLFFGFLLLIGVGFVVRSWLFPVIIPTTYVLASPEKGTLVVSVSGTGQVSALDEVSLKPKVTGDLVWVAVANGESVKAGQVLATIDATEVQKSIRDARVSLTSAEIAYQKLTMPTDSFSLLQSENAIVTAQESQQRANDELVKAYTDGYDAITDAFLDFPGIMADLNAVFWDDSIDGQQLNADWYKSQIYNFEPEKVMAYRQSTEIAYQKARASYDIAFADYRNTPRDADPATIEALLQKTYTASQDIAEAIKVGKNFTDTVKDVLELHSMKLSSSAVNNQSKLVTMIGTTNEHLSRILSVTNTIDSAHSTITSSERTIREKQASLNKLKNGTEQLDLDSQKLTIQQRKNTLRDMEEKLADYTLRAPFSGDISGLTAKEGDLVSPSSVVATLLTKSQVAEISLNEVDVAKVTLGQKSTLTFDALPELTMTGKVIEIDAVGTTVQGVVTYGIKISFDTPDARIKPGMSVSASIITMVHQDVLMVENSAIKQKNGTSVVSLVVPGSETFTATGTPATTGVALTIPPVETIITAGIANDEMTEVVSGLSEESRVVLRTVVPSTKVSAPTASTQSGSTRSSTGMGMPSGGMGGLR